MPGIFFYKASSLRGASATKQSKAMRVTLNCFAALAMTVFMGLLFAPPARADCTSPAGVVGQTNFNDDHNMLQYCDGNDNWIPMYFNDYRANGVTFEPGTDYLNGLTSLAGVSDGKKMTGSFWIRRNGTFSGSQNLLTIGGTSNFRYVLTTGSQFRIEADNPGGSLIFRVDTTATINDYNWHHVMFSVDMSDTGKRHIYIDGASGGSYTTYTDDIINYADEVVAFATTAGSQLNADIADFWFDTGTYIDLSDANERKKFIDSRGKPVHLGDDGSRPTGEAPDIFLSGDTASWHTNKGTGGGFTENGALSDAPGDPGGDISSGLVGYWRLDEGSGTATADASGTGNDGTLENMDDTHWVEGRINKALDFKNGVADLVDLGSDASLDDLHLTGGLTATAWIYPRTAGSATLGRIVDKDSNYNGYWTFAMYGDSAKALQFEKEGATDLIVRTGNNKITFNQWQHVAVTWDGSTEADNVHIYVNGSEVSGYAIQTDGVTMGSEAPYPLRIGARRNGDFGFDGYIDEVRVYNRPLDPVAIAHLAGCTGPAKLAGTMIYDSDNDVMTFCDGKDWLAMAEAGDGGAGCSSPAGDAGAMIFNTDWNTMQYCEGDEWIAVGKGCRDQPGVMCEDGTVYAGLSPDGNVPMYTTPCDRGQTWDGSSCTGTRTNDNWNNGNTNYTTTGITSGTDGDGNTASLILADSDSVAGGIQPHDAAQYCADLVQSGHSDWYLPASAEMQPLVENKNAIGNFSGSSVYWSSTEASNGNAYYVNFATDTWWFNTTKSYTRHMRCVRKD